MKKLPPLEERESSVLICKIFIGAIVLCFALFQLTNFILLFFATEEEVLQITFKGAQIVDLTQPGISPVWMQMVFLGTFVFIMTSFALFSIVPSFKVLKQRKEAAERKNS